MSKNPNSSEKSVKKSEPMNGAMKFFLGGCLAELYLFMIRHFYVNGDALQQIAWYDQYFKYLLIAGVAVLVLGLIFTFLGKADRKKRSAGLAVTGAGAFLSISTGMVWGLNAPALTLLSVVVPVVMLLGILWVLYDRECALSLSILGAALIVLWVCRKSMSSMYLGTYVKIAAVVYLLLVAAIAYLTYKDKLTKLLPASCEKFPVYLACGLSAVGVLLAFFVPSILYYAMWALAIVVFALAVYYTVKQL